MTPRKQNSKLSLAAYLAVILLLCAAPGFADEPRRSTEHGFSLFASFFEEMIDAVMRPPRFGPPESGKAGTGAGANDAGGQDELGGSHDPLGEPSAGAKGEDPGGQDELGGSPEPIGKLGGSHEPLG